MPILSGQALFMVYQLASFAYTHFFLPNGSLFKDSLFTRKAEL